MIARLQRAAALLLALAALVWAAVSVLADRPEWAPIGVLLVAAAYASVLGVEFVLLWLSYASADPLRPRPAHLLRAWAQETLSSPCVFLWRQPFRWHREPDHLPASARNKRGVVFVHGFLCNRAIWNPWMARLRRADVPFTAVDLEPVFGPIERYAQTIDKAIRETETATGRPPVIVAHSMGGLAVRAWLAGSADRLDRCHRIVTVATPHRGTAMARFSRFANVRDMRLEARWLTVAAGPAVASRFVCFWSHCDNIVFPTRNAFLDGADHRHLAVTPHVKMVYHPAVYRAVRRLIRDKL